MLKNEALYQDSERYVLGALLLEQNALLRVNHLLRSTMFFTPVHREIYACMEQMFERGQGIDMLTVSHELKNQEEFIRAGGFVCLAKLSGRVLSSAHLEQHAALVYDAHMSRRVICYGTQLAQLAAQGELCGDELLLEARVRLEDIDREAPLFDTMLHAAQVVELAQAAGIERMALHAQGLPCTGIPTGLPDLDRMLGGWQNSELNVLAARPSIGKTALALHFAKAAFEAGKHTVIYSIEMSATKLGDRFILSCSDVDPDRWRLGHCDISDMENIRQAGDELSQRPWYIDDTSQISMNQIKAGAKRMQMKGLCDLLIIDYLQLSDMKESNKQNKQEMVSLASRQAKGIAKELNIPVILLSQLNRESESRPGRKPELADLRDSGAIEQDADVVILINRPEHYGIYVDYGGLSTVGRGELDIAKNRNGSTGPVLFSYNPSLTKIGPWTGEKPSGNPSYRARKTHRVNRTETPDRNSTPPSGSNTLFTHNGSQPT